MPEKAVVAVFFGGNSNEHEISVITGMFVVNLLRNAPYRVVPVYLARGGGMFTSEQMRSVSDFRDPSPRFTAVRLDGNELKTCRGKGKRVASIDVALNCCHGGMGEDGTLSALLAWNGIRSASPDVPVSAVCMNKTLSKLFAQGLGFPVLPWFSVREEDMREREKEILSKAEAFGYPAVVKPVRLGSSIGVRVVRDAEALSSALTLAFRFDDEALVERYLEGKRDVNCAAFRREGKVVLSSLEEVFSGADLLTFEEKYEGKTVRPSEFPADLPAAVTAKIEDCTRQLYEAFHAVGIVRADFLVVGEEVYFNECNTVPGSLASYLFGRSLTDCRDLLVSLVEEGLHTAPRQKEIFVSGILNENLFSKGKTRLAR